MDAGAEVAGVKDVARLAADAVAVAVAVAVAEAVVGASATLSSRRLSLAPTNLPPPWVMRSLWIAANKNWSSNSFPSSGRSPEDQSYPPIAPPPP